MSSRRHHEERPFAKLTDEELLTLQELSQMLPLVAEHIAVHLRLFDDLAERELTTREFGRALHSRPPKEG